MGIDAVQWRLSPSFPCYEISEVGDVRRVVPGIRGGRVGKVMKPYVRDDGYDAYILRRDNRSFHRKAHQLVIEAFVGPPPSSKHEVRHKDGSRTNNHYSNLEWGTSAENKRDMLRHGTRMQGDSHANARLTPCDIAEIKRRLAAGDLQRIIAEDFGVRQSQISRINTGVRWACL